MLEHFTYGDTLPQALHRALAELQRSGQIVPCPEYNTRCKELSLTFKVSNPANREPMISKLACITGPEGLEKYRREMLDGDMDWAVAAKKLPYTYHDRFADQLPMVMDELRQHPDTRRACLVIRRPEDISLSDPPCLQHIQFFLRGGTLDMDVLFRSNDAVKAAFMNAFALIQLQARVANELGVDVGSYTHRANSFHAYERDWGTLDAIVQAYRDRADVAGDCLAYSYENDWAEWKEG